MMVSIDRLLRQLTLLFLQMWVFRRRLDSSCAALQQPTRNIAFEQPQLKIAVHSRTQVLKGENPSSSAGFEWCDASWLVWNVKLSERRFLYLSPESSGVAEQEIETERKDSPLALLP